MDRFSCPDHDRLVVQLAQGRLDDTDAARAERALVECPACSSWWDASFEPSALAALDAAVADGLADFRAPRRATRHRWLAAAAAAVVAAGVGTLWWHQQVTPSTTTTAAVAAPVAPGDTVLARWTFEEGSIEVVEAVIVTAPSARELARPVSTVDAPAQVIELSFESGDLSGWSSHT